MRLLSNFLVKGKPAVLPDRTIRGQSHYFIYRPRTSLESGIFPDKLKIAKVIPVHKKGDARDVSNYRPISLLPVFSKLLEKLMYNRLPEFIERNEVLTEAQHGFRTKIQRRRLCKFH